MRIIAFDPGYTTGVAFYEDATSSPTGHPEWELFQVTGLSPLWDTMYMVGPTDRVVYESFLYQRRDKVDLRPVEAIGVIRLYCERNGIIPVSQTPAAGKRFWTDERIKTLGLWQTGQPHAMDALRHLLYYRAFGLKHIGLLEALK